VSESRSHRRAGVATVQAHIALAGNPNVGKSSLYNRLTGSHQHVANWPGKTVERHVGTCRLEDVEVEVVDLPGTYSLAGTSPEEQVTATALTDPDLDVVVVVLDSTNLERNLYLAAQVAELGRPMVVVLNLTDAATRDGFVLDDAALSRALGAPVVRTVARTGVGLDDLRAALSRLVVTGADRATRHATPGGPAPTPGAAEARTDVPPEVSATGEVSTTGEVSA
jgi:ferrous iron transport protein B